MISSTCAALFSQGEAVFVRPIAHAWRQQSFTVIKPLWRRGRLPHYKLQAGEVFLANRPWPEIWWGLMHLDLFSGWRIAIWIERDALGVCHAATAADGRNWIYGCQRDDWTLGPGARILEPLGLLSARQRQALEARLRRACCWPAPEPINGGWMTPLHQLQRVHPRGRQSRPHRSPRRSQHRTGAASSALCPEAIAGGKGSMG